MTKTAYWSLPNSPHESDRGRATIRFVGGPMHNQHARVPEGRQVIFIPPPAGIAERVCYFCKDQLIEPRPSPLQYHLTPLRGPGGSLSYEYHLEGDPKCAGSGNTFAVDHFPDWLQREFLLRLYAAWGKHERRGSRPIVRGDVLGNHAVGWAAKIIGGAGSLFQAFAHAHGTPYAYAKLGMGKSHWLDAYKYANPFFLVIDDPYTPAQLAGIEAHHQLLLNAPKEKTGLAAVLTKFFPGIDIANFWKAKAAHTLKQTAPPKHKPKRTSNRRKKREERKRRRRGR